MWQQISEITSNCRNNFQKNYFYTKISEIENIYFLHSDLHPESERKSRFKIHHVSHTSFQKWGPSFLHHFGNFKILEKSLPKCVTICFNSSHKSWQTQKRPIKQTFHYENAVSLRLPTSTIPVTNNGSQHSLW